MLPVLIFLAELLISVLVFIWIASMLGFADDAHRNQKARFSGKLLVIAGISVASLPLLATLYTIWQYYLSENPPKETPLIWWIPIVVTLICFPGGIKIAQWYDTSYKKKK